MSKPSRSAYTALPSSRVTLGSEAGSEDEEEEPLHEARREPSTNRRGNATALHVDQSFRRWTQSIAQKLKRKRHANTAQTERNVDQIVEIMSSVFAVWESESKEKGKGKELEPRTLDHNPPMELEDFNLLVDQVREAIEAGVAPRLNSAGSSGSYFARDSRGTTLGIFKPKDEEPYGRLNPKFTKWVHRNFLSSVIPFGRACLIPQLSYLSEAGASLLDRRLKMHIVPRTEVVELASGAFYYDWIDRERARSKGGQYPLKAGSFQVFLKGFQDASKFLQEHPFPGRLLSQTLDTSPHRRKRVNLLAPCQALCGRADAVEDEDDEVSSWGGDAELSSAQREEFKWTDDLCENLRLELEKLVILDYLMRNTDRGLDNFMLKWCSCSEEREPTATSNQPIAQPTMNSDAGRVPSSATAGDSKPHLHLAAIDNSLSFPHQHPGGWRSYTYGWLYLPISLIGLPFSPETREQFLPLLSSPTWWAETTLELRQLFSIDEEFREDMFLKQLALMKGQAWNLVQSLRNDVEGPLELCRRSKKMVYDDYVEVMDDETTRAAILATSLPYRPTISETPRPLTPPTHDFPPLSPPLIHRATSPIPTIPMQLKRASSDRSRPPTQSHSRRISVSSVLSSSQVPETAYGSLTGVSMMAHLDRVEAEGRDLRNTFGEYKLSENEEEGSEVEEGERDEANGVPWGARSDGDVRTSIGGDGGRSWKERVRETLSFDLERSSSSASHALPSDYRTYRNRSGSVGNLTTYATRSRPAPHGRHASAGVDEDDGEDSDWLHVAPEEEVRKKIVVFERLESVEANPIFTW